MNPTKTLIKFAAGIGITLATAHAATYTNLATNPANSTWNAPAYWSSDPSAVSADHDYQVNPDQSRIDGNNPIQTFTINIGSTSTAWQNMGFVRDFSGTTPTAGSVSTFAGNKLILTDKTAFRSFGRATTTVANWEMQSGSFMYLNATGAGTNAVWEGSITTSGTTALGLVTNNATVLTVNASLVGTGTLNLFMSGGAAANLNLNGDISGFTGTFLLSGTTTANALTRTFSISESATSATLQLNWESTAFRYDLADNDVTFASLILGTDTVLAPNTYDADALNALTGNAGIFSGTGTITVIPEPGTAALAAVAALAGIGRRRRHTV